MVTTARRERPPSGRVSRPSTASSSSFCDSSRFSLSDRPMTSGGNQSHQGSARRLSASSPFRTSTPRNTADMLRSARSDASELSTTEVLRRIKEKNEAEQKALDAAEIAAMGPYNAFSRSKISTIAPLRSVLLDPAVNNFPKSRTRSELMKRIKTTGVPHTSYDLDMDGYVSQEDYKLAKRFDLDGNGVLDPEEREVCKRILAEEFFKRHANDLYNFGPNVGQSTHKQNVERLVSSHSFERSYEKLMSVERTLIAESSKPIKECMIDGSEEAFKPYKYYTDKFDATAWNDYDRIPRMFQSTGISSSQKLGIADRPPSPSHNIFAPTQSSNALGLSSSQGSFLPGFGSSEHGGSRRRLLISRKEEFRTDMQSKFSNVKIENPGAKPMRRVNLITDIKIENS